MASKKTTRLNLDEQFASVARGGDAKEDEERKEESAGGAVTTKMLLARCRQLCRNLNRRLRNDRKPAKSCPRRMEDLERNIKLFRHIVAQQLRELDMSPAKVRGRSFAFLKSMLAQLMAEDNREEKKSMRYNSPSNISHGSPRTQSAKKRSPFNPSSTSKDLSPMPTMSVTEDLALRARVLSQIRRFMLTRAFSNEHRTMSRVLTDSSTRDRAWNSRNERAQRQHRKQRLRQIFEQLDENCRGHLASRELKSLMALFTGDADARASRTQVRALRCVVDIDSDGKVTADDFVDFMYREVTASRLHIKSFNALVSYLKKSPKVFSLSSSSRSPRRARRFGDNIEKETPTIDAPFPEAAIDASGRTQVILLDDAPQSSSHSPSLGSKVLYEKGIRTTHVESVNADSADVTSSLDGMKSTTPDVGSRWAANFLTNIRRRDASFATAVVGVRVRSRSQQQSTTTTTVTVEGRDAVCIQNSARTLRRSNAAAIAESIDADAICRLAKNMFRLHFVSFERFASPFVRKCAGDVAKMMEVELSFGSFEERCRQLGVCSASRDSLRQIYAALIDVEGKTSSTALWRDVAAKLFDFEGSKNFANDRDAEIGVGRTRFVFPSSVYSVSSKTRDLWTRFCLPALQSLWCGSDGAVIFVGPADSGKSYTMLGKNHSRRDKHDIGLLSMFAERLFCLVRQHNAEVEEEERKSGQSETSNVRTSVSISCMEIYREQSIDLLKPGAFALCAKSSPVVGTYVEGLSHHVVQTYDDCERLLREALHMRAIAAFNRNAARSSSHLLITLYLHRVDASTGNVIRTSSTTFLDHAGCDSVVTSSDRIFEVARSRSVEGGDVVDDDATGDWNSFVSTVDRSTVGLLDALAYSETRTDSVLTRILRDYTSRSHRSTRFLSVIAHLSHDAPDTRTALAVIRCVDMIRRSASSSGLEKRTNYEDNLNSNLCERLSIEVERMERELRTRHHDDNTSRKLADDLSQHRDILNRASQTMEQRLHQTALDAKRRSRLISYAGCPIESTVSPEEDRSQRRFARLIKRSEDPSLDRLLVFDLERFPNRAVRRVGATDDESGASIHISGIGIEENHCSFVHEKDSGKAYLTMESGSVAEVYINGQHVRCDESGVRRELHDGDVTVLGYSHYFEYRAGVVDDSVPADDDSAKVFAPSTSPMKLHQKMIYVRMREQKPHTFSIDTCDRSPRASVERATRASGALKALWIISEANAISRVLKRPFHFDIEMIASLDLDACESDASQLLKNDAAISPVRRCPLEAVVVARLHASSGKASRVIFRCSVLHFDLCVERLRCLFEALEPKVASNGFSRHLRTSAVAAETKPLELPDVENDANVVHEKTSKSSSLCEMWWWLPPTSTSLLPHSLRADELMTRFTDSFRSVPLTAWTSDPQVLIAAGRGSFPGSLRGNEAVDDLIDPEDDRFARSAAAIDKDRQIAALISENKQMVERIRKLEAVTIDRKEASNIVEAKQDRTKRPSASPPRRTNDADARIVRKEVERILKDVSTKMESTSQRVLERFAQNLRATLDVAHSTGDVVWTEESAAAIGDDEKSFERPSDVIHSIEAQQNLENLKIKLVNASNVLSRKLNAVKPIRGSGGLISMSSFERSLRSAVRLSKEEMLHLRHVLEDKSGRVDRRAFMDMVRELSEL
eukprot:g1131.t1